MLGTKRFDCATLCADYPERVQAQCLHAPVPLFTALDPSSEVDFLATRLVHGSTLALATTLTLEYRRQLGRRLLRVLTDAVILEHSTTPGKFTSASVIHQDSRLIVRRAVLQVKGAYPSRPISVGIIEWWRPRLLDVCSLPAVGSLFKFGINGSRSEGGGCLAGLDTIAGVVLRYLQNVSVLMTRIRLLLARYRASLHGDAPVHPLHLLSVLDEGRIHVAALRHFLLRSHHGGYVTRDVSLAILVNELDMVAGLVEGPLTI